MACTQERLGRLMVLLDHRALRDQTDLVHREETRGRQRDLVDRREEARGLQETMAEVEVRMEAFPLPLDLAEAQVEDREVHRVARHPHRPRIRLDRTQIGEKCLTRNSCASV